MSEPVKLIIKNPSAKFQFVGDAARVAAHNRIFEMPQIQDSINMALLEFQRRLLKDSNDGVTCSMAGMKLKGAAEFVDILIKLSDTSVEQTKQPTGPKIDHNA